jgi:hypothetical protein
MTGNKHWLVNFEAMDCLHHGIRNKLWMMGYQYVRRGQDEPARKAAITRNWKRLVEFSPGDKFVAYVPGNKFFATGTVINPRRQCKPTDKVDSIESYLKRGKSYTKGFVYFPLSVTYENFTDDFSYYPSRVDVEAWENFNSCGVSIDWPALPRHKTVYAAIEIEKPHYDAIHSALSGETDTGLLVEEVKEAEKLFEGAAKSITVNAYERNRKARTKCIEHHGWNCAVCDYNMAELYGELGEGVVHVHHLRELRSLGEEYEVDPIEDLRPVCPNCHAILHTTSPALSIKKLRKILSKQPIVQWPKGVN